MFSAASVCLTAQEGRDVELVFLAVIMHRCGTAVRIETLRCRPAPQGLDPHGRTAPVHNPGEEDQLDIPAFLRRQAN